MDLFDSPTFTVHVNDLLQKWHVPGCAIGIFQDGIFKTNGYGKAVLGPGKEVDVTGETVFDIASCSKSLTAAAVALLVEDDENYPQVQWDTPVSKLLPDDFVLADEEYTKNVTVEDILSHRSGLPGHDFASMSSRAAGRDTIQSIVRKLRYLEISAPIRSKWMYSNLLYTAAAYLVEHLSGMELEVFLRTRIWEPLCMKSTNLQSKSAIEKGFTVAQPYRWDPKTEVYKKVKMQYCPEAIGAGLVTTTAADYSKWIAAILTKTYPISQDVHNGITRPRCIVDEEDEPCPFTSPDLYATGLSSSWYRGYEMLGHNGGDPGIASAVFFLPAVKFGCVIFTNASAGGNVHPILRHELVDAAIGVPVQGRLDWARREGNLEDVYLKEREEKLEQRRKELSPETNGKATPQVGELERYDGSYWHDGYGEMRIEIKGSRLSIDATGRTMGFTLDFEHLSGGVKYIARQTDYFGDYEDEWMEAEFVLEDDQVVKLGLNLESEVAGGRIWFRRLEENNIARR